MDAHRVAYLTVDANGRPVVATGLVALPAGGPAGLPVVSYDHGTCAASADVPSPFGLGPDHSARVQSRVGFAVGRRVSVEI